MNQLKRQVYLAVSIDVEPDCSSSWIYSDPLTFTGVTTGVKGILQPLFNKYNVCPTYLINNVVLEDGPSVETFRHLKGTFELGTHLHPEFIEPQKLHTDYAGKKGVSNCCFLEPEVETAKLMNITSLFRKQFNYDPLSFRAGRFSAGVNTIKTLISLGYKVDSSVTPHILWQDASREKAVDYTGQTARPYWLNESSYPAPAADGKLLELPVTIGKMRKQVFRSETVWLRPYYADAAKMIALSRNIIKTAPAGQPVILNMMFHNVEVMPGLSPYAADEASAKKLTGQIEDYLKWIVSQQVQGITLSGVYEKLR